jgi:gliding motility-associated-like protein
MKMKNKLLHFIIIAVLLCFPKIDFGQAPTMGTAANFVLFTSIGAVTNTGISQVTGNVGSNVGAGTGFGNVNGTMQSQNPATAACSTDLRTVYNQLASTTTTFAHAPVLGGDTLIAGVYEVTGASTLNNILTLNAQGNANAVFIFKLQGAFSAAANAKVKLINGALACNVFWKIEGLVSIATGVTMRGTIIANNAAINMSANDTLEGRALSTNGAVSVNGVMAYTPLGCGSPFLTGPIAPPLGATGNYVIFSADGPVTNTGITHATGDIGTNNTLTTGFNPLFVNGTIHPIPDTSTIHCAADLAIVQNYLSLLPADIELLYPAQFGRNLVLTPHTYLLNAATALTDTLYLNGQGNPNAVFVIKIYGALSTNTYSNVVLTNGTKSKNVYWLVNGAVSINDYSIFRGTVVANNGAIIITTGSTLDGRAFTTTGAISIANITAIVSNPPTVIIAPTTRLVCVGDTAKFIVSAIGTGLSYQWRKGNVNLVNGLRISGATSDTLKIFPVTYADTATNYNVVIIGNVTPNDTSVFVSLIINSPKIITQPTNQIACIGSNVRLSVTTAGTGIIYQWRKGLINLVNGGNITGANTDTLKINSIAVSDTASNYNVIISNTCAPKDSSINVSLYLNLPVINAQAISQSLCVGIAARFNISAAGSGLTYQWRKGNVNLINGLNITGATTDTLRFNAVTLADAANNYNVIVTNVCSSRDTSLNVSLVINLPIVVTSIPVGQTLCSGGAARFTTVATGTGLTYQWRKGNVNVVNGINITGATSDTLRILTATIIDAANNYNVIVSGTCGKDTSANVSLIINTPIVISSIPVSQTLCSGGAARFTAVATGTGITYQWRKGNVNVVNGINITGATSDTLRILNASITDAANNYNVIVSGTCGKDTSANVSLIINSPIVITSIPVIQTLCSGGAARFTTVATGTGLTYQWRKGNVNVVNGINITGATSDTLRILVATSADVSNNYNVIVSGTCDKDTSINVSLQLNAPIQITSNPVSQSLCIGSSAMFIAAATGSGLTYQWRKGTTNLVNDANTSGASSDTLRIKIVSFLDSASNYNVLISGTCLPNQTSNNVSLILNAPTIIVSAPSNQNVCAGNLATFSVSASGSSLSYQWRKGNLNLVNSGTITGATSNFLTINPVALTDAAADYRVIITSGCSTTDSSANAALIVNAIPIAVASSNSPVCKGESIMLSTPTILNATYHWTGPNSFTSIIQNPIISSAILSDSGMYTLLVTQNTCNSEATSIRVLVNNCITNELFIPEGFSPNGDGINDLFVIRGIENYPNNTFQVFNRWGSMVYDASPYKSAWDGKSTTGVTIGGTDLPVGVYFYTLDLGGNAGTKKGTIYLNK